VEVKDMIGANEALSFASTSKENRPTKILVIEDDTDIRQVICVFLQLSGFEVREAMDGRQAIDIIPEFCPDLIVLDLMMRPVDGWEVLYWLRDNRRTPALPVLVLTARTQLAEQIHGFEAGAVEYMTKPTQPSKLVGRIHSILSLSVEQRAMQQRKRIDERRSQLQRISAPQSDEFLF
jgi:DNA-binding response OmpR family regulator